MNSLPPVPSHLLRVIAAITRWALWIMLSAWFLFAAVWGAIHWVIVPRIGDLRPVLEKQASRVMGAPVTIGAVTAQSVGLIPSFELSDVKLFDKQGRVAFALARVVAALSPQSALGLGFEQLYFEHPDIEVRRGPDGKIMVAGLDFSGSSGSDDGSAANWLFSQSELVIRHGSVRWTDEMRQAPMLVLNDVDLVLRNHYRKHEARLDATPDASLGDRLSVMAVFRQPLLSIHNGQWQQWAGQVYANFGRVDLALLAPYFEAGVKVAQGRGGLRIWMDVNQARLTGATADVTLADVNATLGKELAPLELQSVTGRLGGKILTDGFEVSSQGLQLQTHDGLLWPGGNFRLKVVDGAVDASGASMGRGELEADRLDLAALSQIANRLPLQAQTLVTLAAWEPKGLVENIRANWQGVAGTRDKFDAKGRVVGLALASRAANGPGLRGATVDFDLTQSGGKANVAVSDGAISLPGILEDPLIPFTQLSGDVQWVHDGERLSVQVPNLKFSNADAQGDAQIKWHTNDAKTAKPAKPGKAGNPEGRFPGVLDLQGNMSRMQGTRVHRYLPVVMHQNVRDYVREAVQKGTATGVKFKVKGNLYDMPFASAADGEFMISAKVVDATYAYVPASFLRPGALPWPLLTQLSGDFLIDRLKLQVKGVTGKVVSPGGQGDGMQITKAEGTIPDVLNGATLMVNGEARGGLLVALGLLNASPLGQMIGGALEKSTSTGNAELKLKLNLPLASLDKTAVQGSVTLAGNNLQISPQTPLLTQARGIVNFSERGFSLAGAQARMFGGDMTLEGGSQALAPVAIKPAPATVAGTPAAVRELPGIVLRAKGSVTADGLKQAKDLGFVSRLAQHATGSAEYAAVLGFRQGTPELLVTSNLVGMALNLPQPLGKAATAPLTLRLETLVQGESRPAGAGPTVRLQDRLTLDLARIASVTYDRDISGPDARVLRGSIAVGLAADESAPLPDEGVMANINLPVLDIDAWLAVLSQAASTRLDVAEPPNTLPQASAVPQAPGAAAATGSATSNALGYLPTVMAVRSGVLTVGGRRFNNVVVGGSREGPTWRANMDASELNGYAEYRQSAGSGAGRVYARLARLTLAQASAKDVESLLDQQPASIPALDIVVDDLELRGKRLGRVEIEAINRGAGAVAREGGAREWRLSKFNVLMPEAVFTATGNWARMAAPGPASAAANAAAERRRTVMNFKLDINDSGELLSRFGMKDVIRRGKGKMEGQVAWLGSPLSPDYPSMGGAFAVNVESGQFLKAEPGLAKLLGVLSLQSLPRRLALDFRDVFSEGFSFDFVRGDVTIEQGIASTNNLQMKGVNAAVLMDGRADIARETQDIRVIVVPEINAGTASLIASVINPAIGLGTFLAQLLLRRPLIEASTKEFHIDGSWVDPVVTPVERRPGGVDDKTNGGAR